MAFLINVDAEKEVMAVHAINRDITQEPYYAHTGFEDEHQSSLVTIWNSKPQRKLVFLAIASYGIQTFVYAILANYLMFITFHGIHESNPSYPGSVSANGTNTFFKKPLYDVGFQLTPDWSHRPWLLKVAFVDINVFLAVGLVPFIMMYKGWTYEFVKYFSLLSIMTFTKGIVAIMTILPPAFDGQECWEENFSAEQLEAIKEQPFSQWFYQPWGMAHGCNDMLWSGHTQQSALGFLFLDQTLRKFRVPLAIRFFLFIYACVYVGAVLSCRMHYTIDVFCAALVATALFTHHSLNHFIWTLANKIVGNPVDASEYQTVLG